MAHWLSGEWVAGDLATAVVGADLGVEDVSGEVAIVIPPTAGRPRRSPRRSAATSEDGQAPDVRVALELNRGKVTNLWEGSPGAEPLVTFTLPAPDALEALDGTVEPSVLYMQGRLKVDGDLRTALAVLSATASERYRAAGAELNRRTAR